MRRYAVVFGGTAGGSGRGNRGWSGDGGRSCSLDCRRSGEQQRGLRYGPRRIVPVAPTAQTLLASVPHTPCRKLVVPLVCPVQVVPFHLTIAFATTSQCGHPGRRACLSAGSSSGAIKWSLAAQEAAGPYQNREQPREQVTAWPRQNSEQPRDQAAAERSTWPIKCPLSDQAPAGPHQHREQQGPAARRSHPP